MKFPQTDTTRIRGIIDRYGPPHVRATEGEAEGLMWYRTSKVGNLEVKGERPGEASSAAAITGTIAMESQT